MIVSITFWLVLDNVLHDFMEIDHLTATEWWNEEQDMLLITYLIIVLFTDNIITCIMQHSWKLKNCKKNNKKNKKTGLLEQFNLQVIKSK